MCLYQNVTDKLGKYNQYENGFYETVDKMILKKEKIFEVKLTGSIFALMEGLLLGWFKGSFFVGFDL